MASPLAANVDDDALLPDRIAAHYVEILALIDPEPQRDGLVDTPRRVGKALLEMTCGYRQNPADILATTFDVKCDEMVSVCDISFTSLCEHHVLPFTGVAHVAYVPVNRVVGLSKVARLVQCFAQRLQVQERMTSQVADAIQDHLQTKGVGVVIDATHHCMSCRGVRQPGSHMITSALRGCFRDDDRCRQEFLRLVRC